MPSIVHLIHTYGLLTVAAVMGLECIGIPLPGETTMLAAAVYAGTKRDLSITAVIVTAGASAVIGRTIGYVIGREFGYRLLVRYGPYVGIKEDRIKLGQYLFLRWGGKIVFMSQFVPVLRTFAGIFAGANRMPWRPFVVTNFLGSFLWAVLYGVGAYWMGRGVERYAAPMIVLLAVITVAMFVGFGIFINRHETQLTVEAERVFPGPLRVPRRPRLRRPGKRTI